MAGRVKEWTRDGVALGPAMARVIVTPRAERTREDAIMEGHSCSQTRDQTRARAVEGVPRLLSFHQIDFQWVLPTESYLARGLHGTGRPPRHRAVRAGLDRQGEGQMKEINKPKKQYYLPPPPPPSIMQMRRLRLRDMK